jgi:hypothetical protein
MGPAAAREGDRVKFVADRDFSRASRRFLATRFIFF